MRRDMICGSLPTRTERMLDLRNRTTSETFKSQSKDDLETLAHHAMQLHLVRLCLTPAR